MKKICHLTSVHQRYDTRILYKECSSLMKAGYEVYLVVADGKGEEQVNGVKIMDVGESKGRLGRFIKSTKRVYKKALEIDADIYHFHDPELIRCGIKLLGKKKKVIYDVHEDFPRQVLSKPYLNKTVANVISYLFEKYENKCAKRFSGILTSTEFIMDRFLKYNKSTEVIFNYPFLEEFDKPKQYSKDRNEIVYIGSLTRERGIVQIVESLNYLEDVTLNIGGKYGDKTLQEELISSSGWSKVNFLGFLSRKEVKETMCKSKIGLVTLLPKINYLDSLPVKMFEYMASGIPVIASDFPLWKSIIDKYQCGVCANPLKTKEIAEKIEYLIKNPLIAEKMGTNGRLAIEQSLNWSNEEKKLVKIYSLI